MREPGGFRPTKRTQAADRVIEMDAANGELARAFAVLDCPAAYVIGAGGHAGAPAVVTAVNGLAGQA